MKYEVELLVGKNRKIYGIGNKLVYTPNGKGFTQPSLETSIRKSAFVPI